MAEWDRFDICEAHCVLEWDYNVDGWLRERPTNKRRMEATSIQLARIEFRPALNLSFGNLTENGKDIYCEAVVRLKLPVDRRLRRFIKQRFVPAFWQNMKGGGNDR